MQFFEITCIDEVTATIETRFLKESGQIAFGIKPENAEKPIIGSFGHPGLLPRNEGIVKYELNTRYELDSVEFRQFEEFKEADEYHAKGYKEYLRAVFMYEGAKFQIVPLIPNLNEESVEH